MQVNPTGIPASPTRSTGVGPVRPAGGSPESSGAAGETTEFTQTDALARLITLVQEAPDVRPEVIAAAIRHMSAGELDTPSAAAETAKAMLDGTTSTGP